MNLLLTNIGRRTYIVKYFLNLQKKYKLKIFLLDTNKFVPAFTISNLTRNFISPASSQNKNYSAFLKNFVKKNKIDIIFPISSWELPVLANEKEYFKKKNVEVIVSNKKTIKACANKLLMMAELKKHNLNYPEIINFNDLKKSLPVIKKRISGNSSKDLKIIWNKNGIPKNKQREFFYQKNYKLQEFGMDILNDLAGNYLHCCVKKKLLMRAGETDKVKIVNPIFFETMAKKISKIFKHVGILDVDFLYGNNKIYLLDLNPRIGGGYPFTHEYGYNYLDKILSLVLNKKLKIKNKKYKSKNTVFSKGISLHHH